MSLDSKVTGITISMVLLTRQLSKESHLARTVQFFFNIVQKAFDPPPLSFEFRLKFRQTYPLFGTFLDLKKV